MNAIRGKFNAAMFVAVDFRSHADERNTSQLAVQCGHIRNASLQSVESSRCLCQADLSRGSVFRQDRFRGLMTAFEEGREGFNAELRGNTQKDRSVFVD